MCQAQGFIANVGSYSVPPILCCSAPQNNLQWGETASPFAPAATLILKQKSAALKAVTYNNVSLGFPLNLLFLFWSRADSVETLLDTAQCRVHLWTPTLLPPLSEQDCHTQVSGHLISAPPPHLIPQYSWPRSLNPATRLLLLRLMAAELDPKSSVQHSC